MNTNELANEIMEHYKATLPSRFNVNWMKEAADMLRQQQVRIDHLLETQDYLYKRHDEQQAEIEALKAKTLTDEEINQVAIDMGMFGDLSHDEIELCRNVLRKAQEK